jgi:hypothetical protein
MGSHERYCIRGYVCECQYLDPRSHKLMRHPQKGPMDILKQTLRNEGFFALYKGNLQ